MTTVRKLIKSAMRINNALAANEEPSADDIDVGMKAFNAMVESMSNDLLNIHKFNRVYFPLVPGQQEYKLGPEVGPDGANTNADWIIERPMRVEQVKLMYGSAMDPSPPLPPVLEIAASVSSGTVPLTVEFCPNTQSTGITNWYWDFTDDGTVDSTNECSTYTYTEPGNYVVKLTAVNPGGTGVVTANVVVTKVPPIASFIPTNAIGAAPYTVNFTDTSLNDPDEWEWDFTSNGSIDSTQQNPSYTYNNVGTYTVSLTVRNSGGESSNTGTVTVYEPGNPPDYIDFVFRLNTFYSANSTNTVLRPATTPSVSSCGGDLYNSISLVSYTELNTANIVVTVASTTLSSALPGGWSVSGVPANNSVLFTIENDYGYTDGIMPTYQAYGGAVPWVGPPRVASGNRIQVNSGGNQGLVFVDDRTFTSAIITRSARFQNVPPTCGAQNFANVSWQEWSFANTSNGSETFNGTFAQWLTAKGVLPSFSVTNGQNTWTYTANTSTGLISSLSQNTTGTIRFTRNP